MYNIKTPENGNNLKIKKKKKNFDIKKPKYVFGVLIKMPHV